MNIIDKQYTERPFYGVRRMTVFLKSCGYIVNHKRVARLMCLMGLEAIYPKRKLSRKDKEHIIYPYLLKELEITRSNQVWSTDITYIRMRKGFIYLVAIMDWYSCYVVSWSISVILDVYFCLEALETAFKTAVPVILNSDQGSQFTSKDFTNALIQKGVKISMDGKGRVFDNIFVERLWRTVKYEEVYLKEYADVADAIKSLRQYFMFYNNERPHQQLNYKTPKEVYTNT
ncbi:MAG: IS3 family transposase [Nitrospirae bacterium]|nr:IS3 family transposase [Nitrospirota bacterium]